MSIWEEYRDPLRHVVIPFGYGCHVNRELEGYLDRQVRFGNERKPDGWVFTGGFTQRKSAPGVSEARLMHDYVIPKLTYAPGLVYLEEDSYTTPDNAEKVSGFLLSKKILGTQTEITVFCEATRVLKADLLIRHFLGRRVNFETASWELMAPESQVISTLYDWAAIKFPPLARFWRYKRLKRAEQI